MGTLNLRFQHCEVNLEKGMTLSLKVGINPRIKKPAFLPQIVDQDNLLTKDAEYSDSFRIFIPDRDAEWQAGEIWVVEIESWHISKKVTWDKYQQIERKHIHVYVKILRREEGIKEGIDGIEKELVIQRVSGDCIICETRLPLMEEDKWFRNCDLACLVRFYKSGDRIVKSLIVQTFSRNEYVNHLSRGLKRLSLTSLVKAYEKLPPLPESATLF